MEYYQWILAFHIMSFISWMAMLFYLPRLFIYHRENANIKGFTDVVEVQEYKLYKYIGTPAMWATVISGSLLLYINSALLSSGFWIGVKIFGVIFLIWYHFSLSYIRQTMITNPFYKTSKWLRVYNEVPTLLMILIVIMVIIKPF